MNEIRRLNVPFKAPFYVNMKKKKIDNFMMHDGVTWFSKNIHVYFLEEPMAIVECEIH